MVHEVRASYLNSLPGLPYPEVPVVSVISMPPKVHCEATPFIFRLDPGLGPSFLENIAAQLEDSGAKDSGVDIECSVIHLYPGDFPNLTTGMRAIVSSFLEQGGTPDQGMNALYSA